MRTCFHFHKLIIQLGSYLQERIYEEIPDDLVVNPNTDSTKGDILLYTTNMSSCPNTCSHNLNTFRNTGFSHVYWAEHNEVWWSRGDKIIQLRAFNTAKVNFYPSSTGYNTWIWTHRLISGASSCVLCSQETWSKTANTCVMMNINGGLFGPIIRREIICRLGQPPHVICVFNGNFPACIYSSSGNCELAQFIIW